MNDPGTTHETHDAADASERIVRLLTEHQGLLLGFIRSSVSDHSLAKDILQEVNTVIWRKAADFAPDTNFKAWALQIARFQIMGSRRDESREILLFDSETLADLAVEAEQCDGPHSCGNERLDALEQCLAKLPAPQKEAIEKRYYEGEDILEMTRSLHRTESAVKMLLLRARASLLECVNRILQPTSIP